MTAAGDPDGGDALAQAFEAQRPRLVRVAYATVGSVAEAEDCVQEAWLRLRQVQDPARCPLRPASALLVQQQRA